MFQRFLLFPPYGGDRDDHAVSVIPGRVGALGSARRGAK
jgi:hypothetical protein